MREKRDFSLKRRTTGKRDASELFRIISMVDGEEKAEEKVIELFGSEEEDG